MKYAPERAILSRVVIVFSTWSGTATLERWMAQLSVPYERMHRCAERTDAYSY